MTFSVLATDGDGAVGMAVTSSSPAVAARCVHLRAGVGGAASQNVTDPRLGTEILDALENGLGAQEALDEVVRRHRLTEHRQLTVLGLNGEAAAFSGAKALGVHHHRTGSGVVAAGNMLAGTGVIDAVVTAFEGSSGELEDRLLAALTAGLAAGGEAGPIHSAGLAVVREVAWRETDLRVDWSEDPIGDLRELLKVWLPQRDDYVTRGLNPEAAPSYGVPGDE
ncbi:putative Ntn-hydrolase superfamily protein [Actinocorallia herbida]|uniref:Putative Ntn-hydrolase superfamily protein n=1 Tax=Actinocorallia herbida TaxID=58109 RepID=A0A3N1D077_9ACTN|nr:DUF1028 domain-containing protein [Actinocorallia herbida]ROO86906.1 putative Ntn-hydrolase superfamily protein [Actinocorallia herbida]